MLRLSFIFLLLVPLSPVPAQDLAAPFCGTAASRSPGPGSRTADQPGGMYMTASGTLRILLVFASFPDDTTPHPYWPPHQAPLDMRQFIDPDTTTRSQNVLNLTAYFRQMSLGRFHLIGDAVWVEAAHPQTDYANGSFGRANWSILQERVDPVVDFSRYDAWHRVGDYVQENTPDGLVDMIVMIWRTNIFPFTGEASLGHKPALTLDGKMIAMGFPGSYPDTAGSGVTCEYRYGDDPLMVMHGVAHELGHWLLGGLHPYDGDVLSGKHDYWGMICSGHRRSSCANAYEREKLGWIVVPEVTRDADLALPDYVTTGAALKYHPPHGDPSEYLYFENHRRLSPFDDVTANSADRGLWSLHQQGPYADLDNIRIEPSDGDWTWDNPGLSPACLPIPLLLPVFARGLPAPGAGPSHRDMIPTPRSLVNWMNVFHDESGLVRCGAFYAGEGFVGSYDVPAADPSGDNITSVFSPWSNPPSVDWHGDSTGFALEVLRDSGDVCVVRSPSNPLGASPARRYLGRDPATPPRTGALRLAWGAQWQGGQGLEPDVEWAELVRKTGTDGAWTGVYAGPAMGWEDSSLVYDSSGTMLVSFRARVCDAGGKYSAWSNVCMARAMAPNTVTLPPTEPPRLFSLEPNYPNPFNPSTRISFGLPAAQYVKLEVFDILGNLVKTVVDGQMPAGVHEVVWNGVDRNGARVASGMYVCRLTAGTFTATNRMVLVK